MRKQQQIWHQEHATAQTLPSEMMKDSTWQPSQYVVNFYEFLKKNGVLSHRLVVDIGAGKGGNTLYMAQQGFQVTALDYIQQATQHIEQAARNAQLSSLVQTQCIPVDAAWPFEDNFFDIAIDCFASIDIETQAGRQTYRNELFRTLKPGGYALVVVTSVEDEIEQELIKLSPGPEKNSTLWPSGKFQKNYDLAELCLFYEQFKIIEIETIRKKAHKLGRDFMAVNYSIIIQKPN